MANNFGKSRKFRTLPSFNFYSYADNDPINLLDLDGLDAKNANPLNEIPNAPTGSGIGGSTIPLISHQEYHWLYKARFKPGDQSRWWKGS